MCNFAFPSQVFVGLGFPYEGPAPIEAISLGCVFLQPRFSAPHSSDSRGFYSGKPTTRQVWKSKPHCSIKTRSGSDPDMLDPRFPPSTRTQKHLSASPTCGQWTWPTRPTCARQFEPSYTQRWWTPQFCFYSIFYTQVWEPTFQVCVADFAGWAFHATGVYVWGNAGESSCLCHSPGTQML